MLQRSMRHVSRFQPRRCSEIFPTSSSEHPALARIMETRIICTISNGMIVAGNMTHLLRGYRRRESIARDDKARSKLTME